MKIVSAEYIKSSFEKKGWPEGGVPEIAFAGRSNVGKSSLINSLLNRKKLVKTSSKPGKTRAINFFGVNDKYIFTDLPGYGYASGNKEEVKKWKPMIEEYLKGRESLLGLVHIVDIRRKPDELELMLADWLKDDRLEHILVANKCDKLSKPKCDASSREIEKSLGIKPIKYSVLNGTGKKELLGIVAKLLNS